ncbi:MAG: transglutaminase-like domain-containing protein [Gemmataceae bacterium]|nr:transglutaminase-like domain-containing protein [Gemmataceae bacterium]
MTPVTWKELAYSRDDGRLAQVDIAFVNLACAADLPGAEKIDVPRCIDTLNDWAKKSLWYTNKMFRKFDSNPGAYRNSRNYFRVLAMITHLQRDLGVKYNPAKMSLDVPFDTADTFIHGVIQGDGGTCATLPIIYTAVGRRLGYPIKLVSSQSRMSGHLFCRWHDGQEQLNIEATAQGLSTPSDDDYRNDAPGLYPKLEQTAFHLVSMTPRREMANFLMQRGLRWQELDMFGLAAESFIFACSLAPEIVGALAVFGKAMNHWMDFLDARKPPNFPMVCVHINGRHFPDLPAKAEGDFFACEAMELALTSEELNRKWWGPMKDGQTLPRTPKKMHVYRTPVKGNMTFEVTDNACV